MSINKKVLIYLFQKIYVHQNLSSDCICIGFTMKVIKNLLKKFYLNNQMSASRSPLLRDSQNERIMMLKGDYGSIVWKN